MKISPTKIAYPARGSREVREPTFEAYRGVYERDLAAPTAEAASEPRGEATVPAPKFYIERLRQGREAMATSTATSTD